MAQSWRIHIDTGGTFTDVIAVSSAGARRKLKLLSSGALRLDATPASDRRLALEPALPLVHAQADSFKHCTVVDPSGRHLGKTLGFDPRSRDLTLDTAISGPRSSVIEIRSREPAPVFAARILFGADAADVAELRLATTHATNALLTRATPQVALFITHGHADLLQIGTQQRPDLFALAIRRPLPPAYEPIEVVERLSDTGEVVRPLDTDRLRRDALAARNRGCRIAAISFMHADRHPAHEHAAAAVLQEAGFAVVLSSQTAPQIGYLARTQTTLIEAALGPVIDDYLDRIRSALPHVRLNVMTSAASLRPRAGFRPSESLLSGPAAGAIGAAITAARSGFQRVISFDMGGTSTDVARIDGSPRLAFTHSIEGAEVFAPAVAIQTVAAGGGSVCDISPVGLSAGPGSAGADPGPACYGAGGPLTITDVNLLLGRVAPRHFGVPLAPEAAERALDAALARARSGLGRDLAPEEALEGFLEIANEKMAGAIQRVSSRDGYDPAEYAMLAFGGAGPQHACAVARRLRMRTVIVPPDAGILSAVGLQGAAFERFAAAQVLRPLDDVRAELPRMLADLDAQAIALVQDDAPGSTPRIERRLAAMRLQGQESVIDVGVNGHELQKAFTRRYREVYGHEPEGRAIEIVTLRCLASWREDGAAPDRQEAAADETAAAAPSAPTAMMRSRFEGRWMETPVVERSALPPGATLDGPAMITEAHATTVLEPGWRATVDAHGALVLADLQRGSHAAVSALASSVARVELLANRLTSIAQDMGEALKRTAVSTNVKERLDFSCAVLDSEGRLLANAPHVPVHLGSLGLCVREVARHIDLRAGDAAVTNHPAFGGSHLPDITVLMPVHASSGERLAWVAARAHHAEIGGPTPGSMNPAATTLADEGVVVAPMKIIDGGRTCFDVLQSLLASAEHPSRAIGDNIADVRAALAALHAGADAIRRVAAVMSPALLRDGMDAITSRSAQAMQRALARRGEERCQAEERLDDGAPIRVRIEIADDRARFDFTGSGPVHPGARNATPAIVRSALLYVLRLMIDEPLPLNEGLLEPITIHLPPGMLNPGFFDDPARCPAVGAGNVETSQRLVDTLIKALGLGACSQGTMNNVIFGNERFSYYETVCGGAGAGPGFPGAHAVHTHMTNTRITDPEILEHRHPVRLERFAVRRGSGGAGAWPGGDGVLRDIRFLEPVTLSIIAEHRRAGPYGAAGGLPGAPGSQRLIRADGSERPLADETTRAEVGDRILLETPGGGGYGDPSGS